MSNTHPKRTRQTHNFLKQFIMSLKDTISVYNFVMEQKRMGIPIRETLAKKKISTSEYYSKCKRLKLKMWSEENPKIIKTTLDDNIKIIEGDTEYINDNLSGGSSEISDLLKREINRHNDQMKEVEKNLSDGISNDETTN